MTDVAAILWLTFWCFSELSPFYSIPVQWYVELHRKLVEETPLGLFHVMFPKTMAGTPNVLEQYFNASF